MSTADNAKAPPTERRKSKTELEMEAGRKAIERSHTGQVTVPVTLKETDCTATVIPFSGAPKFAASAEPVDTGITEALAAFPMAPKVAPNVLSGNTDAAIEFLQDRTATHLLWHPQLSFKGTDPKTGEEATDFETASFARDANGNPDWDKVRRWIDNRQGRGNIYWTVNAAKVMDKKPKKKDIAAVVSLHVDLDPREGEDQDAAEERLIKQIEGYRPHASIAIKSGGGIWAIFDLKVPIQIDGDAGKIEDAESRNKKIAHDLGGDNCHNIDRVARLPGTANVPNAKKLSKGRRPKVASVHSHRQVRHAIESFAKAVIEAAAEARRTPLVGQEAIAAEIKIDWSKVTQPGWLQSGHDLPSDATAKLRIIVGHGGNLKELNDQLVEAKLLDKAYPSWSEVTQAAAAGFKRCALSPEQIAEALLADLPFNQHIAKQKDKERAIERAINHAHDTKRAVIAGVIFRDLTDKGKPRPSLANGVIAINALGIKARQDLFHHRIIVKHKGEAPTIREGTFTDDTIGAVRSLINNTFRLDCGDAHTLAAVKEIARDNSFDPVLDYLTECQGKWDAKKRIDTWVIGYMGVNDTPLHRAIGRLMLIASVRRAREPGCKFDQICVLESEEGYNKSTAIKVLAGDENFSDQSVLNVGEREAQEQIEGIWLHESADLTGLRKAEVERVKAFASRQCDRARPAYGRVREDRPRRCTQWATTNDDVYLASQTGNRRFWSLPVGRIDIDALRRDRDQLWGEAATLEAAGASIVLDPKLWPAEHEEQEKRRIVDTWEDVIENMPASVTVGEQPHHRLVQIIHQDISTSKELVRSADVLAYVLKVPTGQQHPEHGKRLARVMKRCGGWKTSKSGRVSILGKQCRGYWRVIPFAFDETQFPKRPIPPEGIESLADGIWQCADPLEPIKPEDVPGKLINPLIDSKDGKTG